MARASLLSRAGTLSDNGQLMNRTVLISITGFGVGHVAFVQERKRQGRLNPGLAAIAAGIASARTHPKRSSPYG